MTIQSSKSKESSASPLTSMPLKTFLATGAVVVSLILAAGYWIWTGYGEQIMNNHKQALLLISRALASSMESSLQEFHSTLDYLYTIEEDAGSFEGAQDLYRQYLISHEGFEKDILFMSDGEEESVLGTVLISSQQVSLLDDNDSIWLASDQTGGHLYLFRRELSDTEALCLAIDADRCYEKWLAGVRIGSSGYIMVKNSNGIILMHPEDSQWGIHVIDGRKELYADVDLSSLEEMVNVQNEGNDGILEYDSYWWMEEPLVKVHKISGYAPVHLGNDFWIISSVVDYDDYSAPIVNGFFRTSLLFLGSLTAIVAMLIFLGTLLTERQRSRQEIATLRALNERLETIHRLEDRIGHQQRLQIIGTMTGGIAHEFNNLLTPIMGYAELLMMELPDDSDAYDNALEIYDASEKAREVIRQLSALSRRNVETVFRKKEALQLLVRSCKMMQSVCPADIRLEESYDLPSDVSILCNPTQINQVLLNLCLNAIQAIHAREHEARLSKGKATPVDGLIRVSARVISRHRLSRHPQMKDVEVPEEWSRYVEIRMEDNGCGMTSETLRQIFTPFFTTKKTGEGTGLGLTLAEQIIVSHRGFIFAESTPLEGSTFYVCLPVMTSSAQDQSLEMFPASSQTVRIVIADDNAKILAMLQKSFQKLSLDVEICRTRSKLQKVLDAASTDVLLIDESLRDCNGIDFCMSIQGLYPRLIKIALADYPTHTLLEAKQRGIIDGYLLKPFSDTDAIAEIRRCSKNSV